MKKNPKKIPYNKISWFNQNHEGEEYSFIHIKKILYLLVSQINEGKTFKIRYCPDCKNSVIVDFKIENETIPAKILSLINLDWRVVKE